MFNTFLQKTDLVFHDRILRGRILFVGFGLLLFRFLSAIPVPGVQAERLRTLLTDFQFLGFLNVFSGGGLSQLSIIMLGLGPYITGSIIMQLSTVMSPRLKAMYHEEGELGRKKFVQYGRLLTVPLAALQGYALLTLLVKQQIIAPLDFFGMATNVIVIIAGAMLLTWIGELMTEFGVGNGTSILIFAGIVTALPTQIGQFFVTYGTASFPFVDPSVIPTMIGFIVVAVAIVTAVVYATEAERPIPITYAKQVRGSRQYGGISTYLPIRINQAGVIPIIFALSMLVFPQVLASLFALTKNEMLLNAGKGMLWYIQNPWLYSITYFVLVFVFTFFYTAITFEPESVATNLQKNGAFIPGVRPGQTTAEYIEKIVARVTLVGATFLAIIAVLPLIMRSLTGIQSLAIGGTALLIVVSVVLDLIKKIDAQISMREY
ncbi:MAG: preprotein translocase subunit SecY [Candidatus Paceibacterota bacterium]|jgi:preprotein translocase subunit SecY|nr:preprotein translocase subunit SecY [Candidatus Paceibacterota bacterium]